MPVTKEFKTIEEQIAGLENRNLKFKNKEKAEILKRYNYFDVINGFETILLKGNTAQKEYDNVYFEDFRDLYFFDMKLKQYTLFKVFDIESRLRTSIAYNFASVYCKLGLEDADIFEQALYVLKEVRNQCAHLELITRFRLKRKSSLNNLNDITEKAGLSYGKLNYMDVVKIFRLFENIVDLKRVIAVFYLKMLIKGRKKIADKALSKMGRKKFSVWMKI